MPRLPKVERQNGASRRKVANMRMVRRIGLYIGLALLAALLSAGVAYAAARMGFSSTLAPWIGLTAFIVCGGDRVFHGVSALVSAQEEAPS